MKGKHLIVTGGLGFVGSHLAETLLMDNDVAIIDNQSTGKLENVSHLIGDNLKIVEGDIQTLNLAAIFEDYEYVFHQAALPSVTRSVKVPLGSHEANITGTLRVLMAAKDAGIRKVVFASSSSVYGDTAELPKREDMPMNPLSPYAVTKVAGEFYCNVFHKIYGLPTISLRYFNVFGPRQDPLSQYAAVIPRFITAILNCSSPVIYGDGQQSRDFTFVKHVVDANVLACESEETGTFNVACGRSISINELVALIGEIAGKTIEAHHAGPRPGDIYSLTFRRRDRLGTSQRAASETSLKQLSGGLKMDLDQAIKDKSARIAVIGIGYVGLPTAVNFAENGFRVIGVSRTSDKVSAINQGCCYLKDLNIDERVEGAVRLKKLTATTDSTEATKKSDVIVITVPTPLTPDKKPDLSFIISAGRSISKGLGYGKLIVLESTVYPGVTDEVLRPILEVSGLKAGTDFGLSYCPERYNPGDAAHSILDVVRIVGGITPHWTEVTAELYKSNAKDVVTVKDIKTAEAAKVIENIQRDLNIALMNELALIFELLHIDIMEVIRAAATKWNFNVYHPGAGVGGHCLPVDPFYLVQKALELGYHSQVITAGRAINDSMPLHVMSLIVDALNEQSRAVKGSKIAVLGLTYKENVGDHRESPSVVLIEELKKKGANVHLVDPYVEESVLREFATPEKTAYQALSGADVLVLMTAHSAFYGLDLPKIRDAMRAAIIVDGRRIFDPETTKQLGFVYRGVGATNE